MRRVLAWLVTYHRAEQPPKEPLPKAGAAGMPAAVAWLNEVMTLRLLGESQVPSIFAAVASSHTSFRLSTAPDVPDNQPQASLLLLDNRGSLGAGNCPSASRSTSNR